MDQAALEERIARLEKGLSLAVAQAEKLRMELSLELDLLKVEMSALKAFLGTAHPSFSQEILRILSDNVQEIRPESMDQ